MEENVLDLPEHKKPESPEGSHPDTTMAGDPGMVGIQPGMVNLRRPRDKDFLELTRSEREKERHSSRSDS